MTEKYCFTYYCIIKESIYKNLNLFEKILFRIGGGNTEDELYAISFNKREATEFVETVNSGNKFRIESRTIERDSDDKICKYKATLEATSKFLRRYSYKNYGYIYLREMDVEELRDKGVCVY